MYNVSVSKENKIKIVGDNVLYNNGIISAYYLLPVVNYSVASKGVIESNIEELTTLLSSLSNQRNGITFTIERIDKVIKAKDVRTNLLETIRMYLPDTEMPPEFTTIVKEDVQNYCLLSVDIQQNEFTDIEAYSLGDAIKEVWSQLIDKIANVGNITLDTEKVLEIEKNIYNIIRHKCLRATKELVFYTLASKIYPNYELSYDKLSIFNEDSFESILGSLTNVYEDRFGYFILHNNGVDVFGLPVQDTYATILTIKEFPTVIENSNFPMNFPNCVITCKTLQKEKATVKLKRERSFAKYEAEDSTTSGSDIEANEDSFSSVELTTRGLREIKNGEVMGEFEVTILVTGISLEELKMNVSKIIHKLNDRDIITVKSLNQATDYWESYVKCRPLNYTHFAGIRMVLSTQMNSGANVGDTSNEIFSPSIGVSL